jgi:hypothetical protein
LGWAPACFAACIFAALLPDNSWSITVALLVSYALLQWVIALAPPFSAFSQTPLLRVWGLVAVNLPVGIWWLTFLWAPVTLPTIPMTIVFVATLIIFALAQPLLWADFLHDLTVEARQSVRWGMLGLALSGLAVALLTTPGHLGGRLILMCLVVIVLAHRTVAGNLRGPQIRVNYYVCFVTALYVLPNLGHDDSAPVLRLGGTLFMLGVIYNTVLSFYNEWRASREVAPTTA